MSIFAFKLMSASRFIVSSALLFKRVVQLFLSCVFWPNAKIPHCLYTRDPVPGAAWSGEAKGTCQAAGSLLSADVSEYKGWLRGGLRIQEHLPPSLGCCLFRLVLGVILHH